MMTNKLLLRVISGVILALFAFWWAYKASELVFWLITFAISTVATLEYRKAIEKKGIPIISWVPIINTILFFILIWFHRNDAIVIATVIGGLILALVVILSAVQSHSTSSLIGWYMFPLVWISIPISSLLYFRFTLQNSVAPPLIILLLMIVTFNDIFAYFGGKNFGRHPLAPVISPKKTIEGAAFGLFGGLVGALLSPYVSDFLAYLFDVEQTSQGVLDLLTSWRILPVVLIVVPISQFGDLVESKFKRYCGVKDSSNFIPGHGGLLDRCDAFLLAIPAFYAALLSVGLASVV